MTKVITIYDITYYEKKRNWINVFLRKKKQCNEVTIKTDKKEYNFLKQLQRRNNIRNIIEGNHHLINAQVIKVYNGKKYIRATFKFDPQDKNNFIEIAPFRHKYICIIPVT